MFSDKTSYDLFDVKHSNRCVSVCYSTVGSLCQWHHNGQDEWQESETFELYKESLYMSCDSGLPGSLVWTVAEDTPDLVYYQVSRIEPRRSCLYGRYHLYLSLSYVQSNAY